MWQLTDSNVFRFYNLAFILGQIVEYRLRPRLQVRRSRKSHYVRLEGCDRKVVSAYSNW